MLKTDNGLIVNPIATQAVAITPADGTTFPEPYVGLYIGGAGAIKVDMFDPNTGQNTTTVTFSGVAAGTTLPICVSRVYSTGTTATLILGLK